MTMRNSSWVALLLGFVLCTSGVGASETDVQAAISSAVSVSSASAATRFSSTAATQNWIIGKWRSRSSVFGDEPWNYCLLAVSHAQLIWTESPGGSSRILGYQILASNSDYIVVRTDEDKKSKKVCIPANPEISYVRFDKNPCISDAQENASKPQVKSRGCPVPFDDHYNFVLTLFRTADDALRALTPLPGKRSHGEELRREYFEYMP